jgi:hypothetical protein
MRYDNMQPRGKVQSYRRIVLPTQQAQTKAFFKELVTFYKTIELTLTVKHKFYISWHNTQIYVHVSTSNMPSSCCLKEKRNVKFLIKLSPCSECRFLSLGLSNFMCRRLGTFCKLTATMKL